MAGTSRMHWRVSLLASAIALMGVAGLAGSQVPTKPTKQDTTASQKRIKISKAGGEVVQEACPTMPDTDAIRADQKTLDSISAAMHERNMLDQYKADEANRLNAAKNQWMAEQARLAQEEKDREALALKRHLARGWYLGFAGGMNAPQRSTRNGYTGGYNFTVPVGFDATDNPWGFRADFTYDNMGGTKLESTTAQTVLPGKSINVFNINADLKLRLNPPGTPTRLHLYALAGVGAGKVTGGVYGQDATLRGNTLSFADAKTSFAWNAGGGLAVPWGPTELFVEARFIQVKSDLPYHSVAGIGTYTSYTPLVVGLTWF
ncbi:MAG TPA: hypothetical protein VHB25_01550 [Gemmatimonadaceae bacterium]|nr:hypothetical protein [Gemmatimonadaceae bacterium]